MVSKPIILSVDDEESDALLLAYRLCGKASPVELRQVDSAPNARAYLQGTGRFGDRTVHPFPDLLLLDINMPVEDGFEVLRFVRAHAAFKYLPAIMLTSSEAPRDRQRAAELGADGYLVKEAGFSQAIQALTALAGVWPEKRPAPILPKPEVLASPRHITLPSTFRERVAQVEARIAASAERLDRSLALLDNKRELVAKTLLSLQRSWEHLRR